MLMNFSQRRTSCLKTIDFERPYLRLQKKEKNEYDREVAILSVLNFWANQALFEVLKRFINLINIVSLIYDETQVWVLQISSCETDRTSNKTLNSAGMNFWYPPPLDKGNIFI